MTKTKLTMKLPKVGDKLKRIPIAFTLSPTCSYVPMECVVTRVNNDHSWYEVEFLETGFRECYHLPDFDHSIFESSNIKGTIPVLCIETKDIYVSISECARAMHLNRGSISEQIHCEHDRHSVGGYHFETIF